MIIIKYDHYQTLGGLGDRIIGLISCKLIAKLLKQPFYIYWNKENIKDYIDYFDYDFELLNINSSSSDKFFYLIDNQYCLKDYLMNETILFPDENNYFHLNQEISQYLYKNKLFSNRNYYDDIFDEYKNLYTKTLKPTPYLKEKINYLISDKKNIIGIQIRAGDKIMITNVGETYNIYNDENIFDILNNIKKHIENDYNEYNIFLTSDYKNVYNISLNIWNQNNIIYYDDIIQHLDRKPVQTDITKIFLDSIVLSQYTISMYISSYSNYGNISALSSIHSNIYDLNCNKIDKKELLSKDEKY